MKLIIVTRKIDGARVYVNPENICAVYPYYDDNYLEAKESADSIAHMMARDY